MTLPALAVFDGLLICAAFCDVRTFRIPNALPLALALGAFAACPPSGVTDLLARLSSAGVVFLICGFMWNRGLIGGGDMKLLAACAVWIPIGDLGVFATWVGLFGAAQGLMTLALHRWAIFGITSVGRPPTRVPYAVSIAGGGLVWSVLGP